MIKILAMFISVTYGTACCSCDASEDAIFISDSKYGKLTSEKERDHFTLFANGYVDIYLSRNQIVQSIWFDRLDSKKASFFLLKLVVPSKSCKVVYLLMDARGDKPIFSQAFGNCNSIDKPIVNKVSESAVDIVFPENAYTDSEKEHWVYSSGILSRLK